MVENVVKRIFKSESGSVLIEFAAVVTVLLILIFPTIDFARYILLQQKTIKMAHSIADSVALSAPIIPGIEAQDVGPLHMTLSALEAIVAPDVINSLVSPFPAEGAGGFDRYQVVISHVYNDAGTPTISWQFDADSLSLNAGVQSNIGAGRGSLATIPAALSNGFAALDNDENIVAVEAATLYQPITPGLQALGIPFLDSKVIRHVTYFPGRNGQLGCIWQVYMPPFDC